MFDRPQHTADFHARRAEDLTHLAQSASRAGWWQRGRRRELLAQAQVHATLGAVAMPAGDLMQRVTIANAEAATAKARLEDVTAKLRAVEDALRDYGQDLLADDPDPAAAVRTLMDRVFNTDHAEPPEVRHG